MPPSKPQCDFSKLSKAKLRKLVDRLMGAQIVCVQADGILVPTFTSALSPLSSLPDMKGKEYKFGSLVDVTGKVTIETTTMADKSEKTFPAPAEDETSKKNEKTAKPQSPQTNNKNTKVEKKKEKHSEDEDEDDEEDEETAKPSSPKTTAKTAKAEKTTTGQSRTEKAIKSSTSAAIAAAAAGRRAVSLATVPTTCKLDGYTCATESGVQLLYPSPVLIHELVRDAHSAQMNEELKELMLSLEEEDEGCTFNLHGGYRSKDGFLSRPDRSVQWLRNQIIPRVHHLLSIANASNLAFTVDGWGAVMRGSDKQNAHVHPGSMYAGVYYVTAPREVANQPTTESKGCLQFFDPRSGAAMAQVVRGKNVYGETIEVCPGEKGGLLVIFPSWLMHEVHALPAKVTGPRIGISFNAVYNPM